MVWYVSTSNAGEVRSSVGLVCRERMSREGVEGGVSSTLEWKLGTEECGRASKRNECIEAIEVFDGQDL